MLLLRYTIFLNENIEIVAIGREKRGDEDEEKNCLMSRPALLPTGTRVLSHEEGSRAIKLTINLHPVPRLR